MNRYHEESIVIPCPTCDAGVGWRCTTKSGNLANWPHAARQEPINAAWRKGYHEGRNDAVVQAERYLAGTITKERLESYIRAVRRSKEEL